MRIGTVALLQHHAAGILDYAEAGAFARIASGLGFNTVGILAEKLLEEGWDAVSKRKEEMDAMNLNVLVNARKEALFDPEKPELIGGIFEVAKHFSSDILQTKINGAFERYEEPWSGKKTRERIRYMKELGKRVSEYGSRYKVRIAVENHIDYRMEELQEIYESVNSPYFGILFDTANQLFYGEDPVLFAKNLGKWVFSTHIKDAFGIEHEDGIQVKWCKPGTGAVDLRAIGRELSRYNRDLPLVIEFFIGDDSPVIPLKHDSYWKSLGLKKDMDRTGFRLLLEAAPRRGPYHPIEGDEGLRFEIEVCKELVQELPAMFQPD